MKVSKTRLTKLMNSVELFSDETDLFGFQGISKVIIEESLSQDYSLLEIIENYSETFEVIYLKRFIAQTFEKCNGLLEKIDKEDNFNKFLGLISKLHYNIKETYISVVKEPIKTDIEIYNSKKTLEDLIQKSTELQTSFDEISTLLDNSKSIIDSIANTQNTISNNDKTSIENAELIKKQIAEISANYGNVSTWTASISNIESQINTHKSNLEKLILSATENDKNINSNKEKLNLLVKSFSEYLEKDKEFQNQIQNTLEGASQHGMAGSFKKRKDELGWTAAFWIFATISSIIALAYALTEFKTGKTYSLNQFLTRLPIAAPFIWLGWFCSKQYGFTSRIREDYSYKYAISMAFEKYKNETKEIDEKLLNQLLELTVVNVSSSPLYLYDTKSNHGTPFHEFFESLFKRITGKANVNIDTK